MGEAFECKLFLEHDVNGGGEEKLDDIFIFRVPIPSRNPNLVPELFLTSSPLWLKTSDDIMKNGGRQWN